MTDDGDAPRATQNLLPLHPTHVVHVRVVFGEAEDSERVDHMGNVKKKYLKIHIKILVFS